MGGVVPIRDEGRTEINRFATEPQTTEGHPRDRWLARLRETIG